MDVAAHLFGFSKALYSNWIFYKPDHFLVDCGEGAATSLGNNSYAIERVLLTHGHLDHIAGLPSLIWCRAAGMGDNNKPLAIYHPRGDDYVADLRTYLEKTRARLPFELTWIELDAGDEIPLSQGERHARRAQTFATQHISGKLTLGYKIVETRKRLRSEFQHLPESDLRDLAHSGAQLMEPYDAILAAFGGDGLALNPDDVRGAELLVHEATILDASDRKHQLHATLDEALQTARKADVRCLLLNHVSGRYRSAQVVEAARESAARHDVDFSIWCLRREKLWQVVAAREQILEEVQR